MLRSQAKHLKEFYVTRESKPDSGFTSSNLRTILQLLSVGNLEVLKWENQRYLDLRFGTNTFTSLTSLWQKLKVLSFSGTELGDEKFFELNVQMPNLLTLELGECKLDKDGLFKILDQPENYPSLQSLHFNKNKLQIHKWKNKDKKRFLKINEFPQLSRIELAESKSEDKGYSELMAFLSSGETGIGSQQAQYTLPLTGLLLTRGNASEELLGLENLNRVATIEQDVRELLDNGVENLMLSGSFINTQILDLILVSPPNTLKNVFCVQANITFTAIEDYRQRFNNLGIRLHSVNTLPEATVGDVPHLPLEPAPVYLLNFRA